MATRPAPPPARVRSAASTPRAGGLSARRSRTSAAAAAAVTPAPRHGPLHPDASPFAFAPPSWLAAQADAEEKQQQQPQALGPHLPAAASALGPDLFPTDADAVAELEAQLRLLQTPVSLPYKTMQPTQPKAARKSRPVTAAAGSQAPVPPSAKGHPTPLQRNRAILQRALARFHRAEEREAAARARAGAGASARSQSNARGGQQFQAQATLSLVQPRGASSHHTGAHDVAASESWAQLHALASQTPVPDPATVAAVAAEIAEASLSRQVSPRPHSSFAQRPRGAAGSLSARVARPGTAGFAMGPAPPTMATAMSARAGFAAPTASASGASVAAELGGTGMCPGSSAGGQSVPFWLPLSKREGSVLMDEVLDGGPVALGPDRSLRIHRAVERELAMALAHGDPFLNESDPVAAAEEEQRRIERSQRDSDPYSYNPALFPGALPDAAHPAAYLPYLPAFLARQERRRGASASPAAAATGPGAVASDADEVVFFYAADGSLQQRLLPPPGASAATAGTTTPAPAAAAPAADQGLYEPGHDPSLPNLLGFVMSLHPERMALRTAAGLWRARSERNATHAAVAATRAEAERHADGRLSRQLHALHTHPTHHATQPQPQPPQQHQSQGHTAAPSARASAAQSSRSTPANAAAPRRPPTAPSARLDDDPIAREMAASVSLSSGGATARHARAPSISQPQPTAGIASAVPPLSGSTASLASAQAPPSSDAATALGSSSEPVPAPAPAPAGATVPDPASSASASGSATGAFDYGAVPSWKSSIMLAEAREAGRMRAQQEWARKRAEAEQQAREQLSVEEQLQLPLGWDLSAPMRAAFFANNAASPAAAAAASASTASSQQQQQQQHRRSSGPRHRVTDSGPNTLMLLPLSSFSNPVSLASLSTPIYAGSSSGTGTERGTGAAAAAGAGADIVAFPAPFVVARLSVPELARVPRPNWGALGDSRSAELARSRRVQLQQLQRETMFDPPLDEDAADAASVTGAGAGADGKTEARTGGSGGSSRKQSRVGSRRHTGDASKQGEEDNLANRAETDAAGSSDQRAGDDAAPSAQTGEAAAAEPVPNQTRASTRHSYSKSAHISSDATASFDEQSSTAAAAAREGRPRSVQRAASVRGPGATGGATESKPHGAPRAASTRSRSSRRSAPRSAGPPINMALAASSASAASTASSSAADLPSGAELEHLASLCECLYTFLRSAECTFCALELVSSPALDPATEWLRDLVAECVAFELDPAAALHEIQALNAGFLRVADALREGDKVVEAFRAHLLAAGRVETKPRPLSAVAAAEGTTKDAAVVRRPVHRVTQSHFSGGASSHSPSHAHSHARSYSTATARPASAMPFATSFGGGSSLQARVLRPPSASAALASVTPLPASNRPASASSLAASTAASVSLSIAEADPALQSVHPELTPEPEGSKMEEQQQQQQPQQSELGVASVAETAASQQESATAEAAPPSEQPVAIAAQAESIAVVAVSPSFAPSEGEDKSAERALDSDATALPSVAPAEEKEDSPASTSATDVSEAEEAPHTAAPAAAALLPALPDENGAPEAKDSSDAAAPSNPPALAVIYSASSAFDQAQEIAQPAASPTAPLENGAADADVPAIDAHVVVEKIEPAAHAEPATEAALDSVSAAALAGVTAADQLPSSDVAAESSPVEAAPSEAAVPTVADVADAPTMESPADGLPAASPPADVQPPASGVGECGSA